MLLGRRPGIYCCIRDLLLLAASTASFALTQGPAKDDYCLPSEPRVTRDKLHPDAQRSIRGFLGSHVKSTAYELAMCPEGPILHGQQ